MDELYLENIDELVTDQNKIVTYKWLSHNLGVHVNQAKQMLYDYVTRKRKENISAQVHVTYLVTGEFIQNGYPFHKVAVVKEERLEATKARLKLVANVHVYSVQKATLKDSGPLFNTDYDVLKNNLQNCNKFSAIQCADSVPRSPEDMSQLRKSNFKETESVQETPKPTVNGHGLPPAAKAATQQPKGIMGMFSRQTVKQQESQKEAKAEPKESVSIAESSKPSAKANAMNNFFGKASLNKIKETSSTSEALKEEKPSTQSLPVTQPPPTPAAPPEEMSVEHSEPTKKKKSRKKRADSDEEEEKTVKKRRRIKKPQSDSSEDESVPGPCEVKTPPPSPPPPSPPPSPPQQTVKTEVDSQLQPLPGGKRRKRRRVLKSKTFLDDEGCIVTEKVYESESCTDSEEEFAKSKPTTSVKSSSTGASKPETKTSKKAPVANKGTKQASIMGFFQKK
ncbi:DNA polymerase delta subunit 3 [Bombina bombina]|uniref:DNA polymerase delta subunit 3 n=1 Tax=Bombina bombina TaxID=8345 RepID=UPI00235AA498|nr:DNA polymerase delta subunit 3 [Bombina bombina]